MHDTIRLAAEAAARRVVQTRSPRVWNGSVVSYDIDSNVASVTLDGDVDPIDAVTVGSFQPEAGARVLVLLTPPSAAFVLGTMTTTPAVEVTASKTTTTGEEDDGVFDEITVGGVLVTGATPGVPTGLIAVSGGFSDQSYVDLTWANGSPPSYAYQVEIARRTGPGTYTAPYQQYSAVSESLRIEGLTANTNYGVRVCGVSRIGVVGAFSAWVDFTSARDLTVPPKVTNLTLYRGPSSILAAWDISTADDVKNGNGSYKVQASQSSTFSGNPQTEYTSGNVHSIGGIDNSGTWYVRVAAVDNSGNEGPYSDTATIDAGGITGTMILADAVGSSQLGPGAVTFDTVGFAIGGGNLLKNSSFENSTSWSTNWAISNAVEHTNGRTGSKSARVSAGGYVGQTIVNLPIGTYVASAWVRSNALTTSGMGLFLQGVSTASDMIPASNSTTDWVRRTLKFTTTTVGNLTVYVFSQSGGSGTFDVDDFQLEMGEVPTSYAPKPDEILPGTVGTAEIAANAVTAAKITANTITAAQIAADTITSNEIAANAITTNELAANAVTASKIAADTITANEIAANAITATELAANAVTAGKIAANAITATNIQAGAVTTDKLTVAQAGDNKIVNGEFEGVTYTQGTQIFPESWGNLGTIPSGVVHNTGTGANGIGTAVRIAGGASSAISKGFPILSGQTYMWSLRYLAEATLTTGILVEARVMPSAGTYDIAGSTQTATLINNVGGTNGVWNYAEGKFSATSNGYLIIRLATLSGAGTTGVRFDEIVARPVERSVTIADGAIDAVNITANAIRTTHIMADNVVTAHMTANTISGDRISANSLSATKLTTSTLTSTTITLATGGQLMAGTNVGSGGTGLLLNSDGVSLYNGNTRTVHLNAATGTATFTGTVNATGGQFSGSLTSTATITGGTFITTAGSFRANDDFSGYAEMSAGETRYKSGINGGTSHYAPAAVHAVATSTTFGYIEITAPYPLSTSAIGKILVWGGGRRDIEFFTPSGTTIVKQLFQVDGESKFWNNVEVVNGYLGTSNGLLFGKRDQEGDWDELAIRSIGANSTAGIALHSESYGTAAMLKWDGPSAAFYFTNTADTAGIPVWAASYNVLSSERFKSGITDSSLDMSKFSQLSVREFEYKPTMCCTDCDGDDPDCSKCAGTGDSRTPEAKNNQDRPHYGLVAEEVAAVYPQLVQLDMDGNPYGLALDQLVALLLQKVLEQETKIKALRA